MKRPDGPTRRGSDARSIAHDVFAYVGCASGAALREDYFARMREAGLAEIAVLKDVDYLEGLRQAAPAEAEELLARTGVRWEDVAGRVRSLTIRARKAS